MESANEGRCGGGDGGEFGGVGVAEGRVEIWAGFVYVTRTFSSFNNTQFRLLRHR